MAFSLRVINVRDFIRMDMRGTIDWESSRQNILKIAWQSKDISQRLLVDIRQAKTNMTYAELLDLARLIAASELSNDRIAILYKIDRNTDRTEFLEGCSRMHGVDIRSFDDIDDALIWLSSSKITQPVVEAEL